MSKSGRLFQLSNWKPKARERAVLFAVICSPLSVLLCLFSLLVLGKSMSQIEKPVDTYAALTDVTRVQNFARNSLLLWMGGNSLSQKPLLARSSAGKSIELSEAPFEVRSIEPSDIERWQGSEGSRKGLFKSKKKGGPVVAEWRVTFAVTFVAPGSGTAQINRYAVVVLQRDTSYQLLLWPMIVNNDSVSFSVASKYTQPVSEKSPLTDSLNRFVTAYLTSAGGATSLGQYVSSNFHGSAVVDSPYTEAEIKSIKSAEGDPQVHGAKPGTQLRVLVQVKASSSIKTWSVMDIPLRVSLGANGVWLVDSIDSPIGWGEVTGG